MVPCFGKRVPSYSDQNNHGKIVANSASYRNLYNPDEVGPQANTNPVWGSSFKRASQNVEDIHGLELLIPLFSGGLFEDALGF